MISRPEMRSVSPEVRTTLFYATMFMTAGGMNAFGGIWLEGKGLSEQQIGVINATPVLSMLLVNLFVGRIADRAKDWRQVIVIGALAAAVLPLGLFWANSFWPILLFWSLGAVALMAIIPVIDAAAMRMSKRRGSSFGAMRAWGTIGYLVVIVTTGFLTSWFGAKIFLPLLMAVGLLRGLTALALPRFRAPQEERTPTPGATRLLEVMRPWFLLPLIGFSIIFGSHLILNAFQGLLWERQGISLTTIGLLIALGALSEAAMFFVFSRFAQLAPARVFVLISAVVTVFRWIAFGFEPGVPILIGLQLLHGITYGLGFMACVGFISTWTSEDIAAEAQSFFFMLQQGFSVFALLVFGWLVNLWGAQAYFGSALFALVGVICIWLSLRLKPPAT